MAVDSLELDLGSERGPAIRLLPQFEMSLDCVVLTHPHQDHSIGFRAVLDRAPSAAVVGCGEPFVLPPVSIDESPDAAAQLAWGATEDALMAITDRWERFPHSQWLLRAGTHVVVGDAKVTCLYPDQRAIDRYMERRGNPNVCSAPLLIEWHDVRLLLGADLPSAGWKRISSQRHDPPLADHLMLKVPHHGSRRSRHACYCVCKSGMSRTWVVAPLDRGQGPPRFDDGHDVAVMLESVPAVHLTWAPTKAGNLKDAANGEPVRRSAILAAIERAKFGDLVLEYLDEPQPTPAERDGWVSVGFEADGSYKIDHGAAAIVVAE
jgi:hypothetical protein